MSNQTAWILAAVVLAGGVYVSQQNAAAAARAGRRSGLEAAGGWVEGIARSWFD